MARIDGLLQGGEELLRLAKPAGRSGDSNGWLRQMELAELQSMNQFGQTSHLKVGSAPSQSNSSNDAASTSPSAAEHLNRAKPLPTQKDWAPPSSPVVQPAHVGTGNTMRTSASATAPVAEPSGVSHAQLALAAASSNSAVLKSALPLQSATVLVDWSNDRAALGLSMPVSVSATEELNGLATEPQETAETSKTMAPSSLSLGAASLGAASDNDIELPRAEPGAAPTEDSPALGAPWQKRVMHIEESEQGVNVWIRDNVVQPQATTTLVYRLAGEFAGMGMRLRNAFVNGTQVYRAVKQARNTGSAPAVQASISHENLKTTSGDSSYGA